MIMVALESKVYLQGYDTTFCYCIFAGRSDIRPYGDWKTVLYVELGTNQGSYANRTVFLPLLI